MVDVGGYVLVVLLDEQGACHVNLGIGTFSCLSLVIYLDSATGSGSTTSPTLTLPRITLLSSSCSRTYLPLCRVLDLQSCTVGPTLRVCMLHGGAHAIWFTFDWPNCWELPCGSWSKNAGANKTVWQAYRLRCCGQAKGSPGAPTSGCFSCCGR